MSNFLLKLKVVLWKNCIIRKRHWILTIFEILMSVFIFLLLAYLQTLIPTFNSKIFINETEYHQKEHLGSRQINLLYTPNNSDINKFMDKVSSHLYIETLKGFSTEEDMTAYITQLMKNSTYHTDIGGVVFEHFSLNEKPTSLKYRIRTDMSSIFSLLFPHTDPFASSEKMSYFYSGFLKIQEAVDLSFIEALGKVKIEDDITLQEMPYPPHNKFGLLTTSFIIVLPFCTILAFIFIFPSVLKRVIEEKSTGIKELMKMVGLDAWMLWLGWFIHSMVTNLIAITFIVVMLKISLDGVVAPIVAHGRAELIWIFLFLYCTVGICFSFAISTLFKRPTLGMCFGLLIWIVQFYAVNPIIDNDDSTTMQWARSLILLLPNACLAYGYKAINEFEKKEIGLQWSNLLSKPNPYTPHPSMGCVFMMLILDSILYCIITWYIDNVFPGEYGIARPWYFPFTKSYWISNKIEDDLSMRSLQEGTGIEEVSNNMEVGIQIRDLCKRFGGKIAVNGLSLDIYHNEITVLLGHNGAGKTTTMHIITGMIGASSGKVIVNGYNIQKNMNKIRESLGLCPQHNLQFPDLTVLEHLLFFAMLKGYSKEEAMRESQEFLSRLNLTEKANKMASELSGGMRRKLSLAMTLVGKSKVLMLDEPTSGMDPEARREIWDFLLSMRGERTILITTHYMEEADILGDRIAIMDNGQLQCYGTSLFLKKHYGTGYTLSILVSKSWDAETVTEEIRNFVPAASFKSSSAGCVTYELPTSDTTALSQLFLHLEKRKADFGIVNFGVSLTTLEEVFLKVGELAHEKNDKSSDLSNSETDSSKYLLTDNNSEDSTKDKITSEYILTWQQFIALFIKRCQYALHKWILFIVQMLVPLAMTIFIMAVMKMDPSDSVESEIRQEISLAPYMGAEVFYSGTPGADDLAKYYLREVENQKGTATRVENVSNSIVAVGEKNMDKYHRSLIAAAELNYATDNNRSLNGMYGNWALHGPPIALNLITNALLKSTMKSNEYSISVVNNPLTDIETTTPLNINILAILMWIFLFPIAFTIMAGFFLIFLQEEQQTGVKHLQIMAGVSRALYWLTNYIFDLLVYSIVVVLIMIILLCFDAGGTIGNATGLQALCALTFLYGFASLPFSYLFVYRPTAASVMLWLLAVQIVFGTIGTVIVFVLDALEYEKSRDGVRFTLLLIPNFAFSEGIYKFTRHSAEIDIAKMNVSEEQNRTEMSFYNGPLSLTVNIIFLTVHIILYTFLLLLIDSGILKKCFEKQSVAGKMKNRADETLDDDVQEERIRVEKQIKEKGDYRNSASACSNTSDVLEVSNLRKWFGRFYAVRGLNFGVKSSECFGLLGINGAGKTTTFKMLTGEIFPSTGYADIQGFSLNDKKSTYLKKIGYCPQFDALNMTLTGYEMLTLFARIRGIPNGKVHSHVKKWIKKFGIKKYENVACRAYSGGNKRKLSTAIALIGDPPLIMLDEPTSGVDPVARRNLWDILTVLRKSGQSIVLTSHSMDECEALCDRLAIMVDGQLMCIGNTQYLKKRFGQGFTVMMKLRPTLASGDTPDAASNLQNLKHYFENKYMCTLKDEHTGMLLYHINNPDATLGEVFNFMEKLKAQEDMVEDYTVSDTSLEQVFLSFAKKKAKIITLETTDRIAIV